MWVYLLGPADRCGDFVADLEVSYGRLRMAFSGPVFSLATPHTTVREEGQYCSAAGIHTLGADVGMYITTETS